MSKRKDPAAEAVLFFNSAPIDTARTVLNICTNVVKQREGGEASTRRAPTRSRGSRAAAGEPPRDTITTN